MTEDRWPHLSKEAIIDTLYETFDLPVSKDEMTEAIEKVHEGIVQVRAARLAEPFVVNGTMVTLRVGALYDVHEQFHKQPTRGLLLTDVQFEKHWRGERRVAVFRHFGKNPRTRFFYPRVNRIDPTEAAFVTEVEPTQQQAAAIEAWRDAEQRATESRERFKQRLSEADEHRGGCER